MKHSPIVHDGSHVGVKLKRALVRACKVGKLSDSFSHEKLSPGMNINIYCTSDTGVVTDVVHGTIKRGSRKGTRRFMLLVDQIQNLKVFDVHVLNRI